MGIAGLLRFLKNDKDRSSAITPAHISEFRGQTAAVDAYCWLHKSVYTCARELFMKQETTRYIDFFLKQAHVLTSNGVRPIFVFDGDRLPFKIVEEQRRQERNKNKTMANQLLASGNSAEAFKFMVQAIDITHQLASNVMKAARAEGFECIVAPYEADAQLAYLEKIGSASLVISEDSDLIVYGCKKIFYKLDAAGHGEVYCQSKLEDTLRCKVTRFKTFSFEKFKHAAILSGCDYLKSLPGIGLVKAWKFMNLTEIENHREFLKKVPSYLNIAAIVDDTYINAFVIADMAFKYQPVFDLNEKKRVPLSEVQLVDKNENYPLFLSQFPERNDEHDLQLALGNMDNRHKIYDNYKLDTKSSKMAFNVSEKRKRSPQPTSSVKSIKNNTSSHTVPVAEMDETDNTNELLSFYSEYKMSSPKKKIVPVIEPKKSSHKIKFAQNLNSNRVSPFFQNVAENKVNIVKDNKENIDLQNTALECEHPEDSPERMEILCDPDEVIKISEDIESISIPSPCSENVLDLEDAKDDVTIVTPTEILPLTVKEVEVSKKIPKRALKLKVPLKPKEQASQKLRQPSLLSFFKKC